ncbi:hypothetical protein CCR75_003892 [Bremia lactucae]|uniref:Uncharacterized protein n=1 Tax=Bremia lactucae TaxID=4779 RepID=A0A976II24_BRELC|nr:hypothetical protein CCR75_003892 [Bremia lactucae]
MESIESSLHLLRSASCENLASETPEDVVEAMSCMLAWLYRHDVASVLQAIAAQLQQVVEHLHGLFQTTDTPINGRLWMLWVELCCKLSMLRYCEIEKHLEIEVDFFINIQPPRDLPILQTQYDKKNQAAFSCRFWDAAVVRPLLGASVDHATKAMPKLVDFFLHWMANAMLGYEMIFIANVAAPIRKHVNKQFINNSPLVDAWLDFVSVELKAEDVTNNAPKTSVIALILSSTNSTKKARDAAKFLSLLGAVTVKELVRDPFPQPHHPIAAVAMAQGLIYLDDAKDSDSLAVLVESGNVAVLCQFAALRVVNLKLLSSRLIPYDDVAISQHFDHVRCKVEALMLDSSCAGLQEYSLQMMESCIEETINFYQSSRQNYICLVEAMKTTLSQDLIRQSVLHELKLTANSLPHDEKLNASSSDIVAFLNQFYNRVAPLLKAYSAHHIVRVFVALSRIEFIREACTSPNMNKCMLAITQQMEEELEQSTVSMNALVAPVLRSVTTTRVMTEIIIEADIVAGCQMLAVGLVMQRKIRVLLMQCQELIDDALAIVFLSLFNVFEPADAFAHQFLGLCLARFGQLLPIYSIFPYYLQVTLAAYPSLACSHDLTKVCGTIFGSLFYSKALMLPSEQDYTSVETAERMTLWAIQKCCQRCIEILAEEIKLVKTSVATDILEIDGLPANSIKPANANETNGMYLAGLVFELLKMAPMTILKATAVEVEQLIAQFGSNPVVLRQLKNALYERISQDCEAEKRAWLAIWCVELDRQYSTKTNSRL